MSTRYRGKRKVPRGAARLKLKFLLKKVVHSITGTKPESPICTEAGNKIKSFITIDKVNCIIFTHCEKTRIQPSIQLFGRIDETIE